MDWDAIAARGERRFADGRSRLPDDPDARQRQLVRMAIAAGSVALARLMQARQDDARDWFTCSAAAYRSSWEGAPSGSWGRPIGLLKALVLAGDAARAVEGATGALSLDPAGSGSPIGTYAAALAELVLGRDDAAAAHADVLRAAGDSFPPGTAAALAALAYREPARYEEALAAVLADFEARAYFLEDVRVADTVLVLEALAERRGLAVRPRSGLLPNATGGDQV